VCEFARKKLKNYLCGTVTLANKVLIKFDYNVIRFTLNVDDEGK